MTYRIKKLHNEPGWDAVPIDPRVSQWNAERDAKANALHFEAKAYPPKATVKNDIFPRPHEIYNCTTCTHGEKEHPVHTMNPDTFRVKTKPSCVIPNQWSEGPRFVDIGCPSWDRRIPIPHKGYTLGIDK